MISVDLTHVRFLIIDDNAHMRRILRTLIYGFGARDVYETSNGASGIAAFAQLLPDIIITDWEMPIVNGLEFTQVIRQPGANANPFVPIIMVTANLERKHIITARDAGVTEFLAKPISAKSLHERIASVILLPRPFIRSATYFGPDRRRSVRSYGGEERRKAASPHVVQRSEPLATVERVSI